MNSVERNCELSGIELLKEYFVKKIRSIVKNTENNFPDFIKDCLSISQTYDLNDDDVKIVFFFGAGASLPSGIEETSFINEKALENIDFKVLERYVSTEEFLRLGLDKNLLKKDPEKFKSNLSFEQAMGLLRLFYGDFPECAEVLFFQKFFPRQDPIDPWRDLLPIPLIYEITAHLVSIGLVDHIITTNFDELLDRALFLESQQTKEIEKIYHLSAFQSALKNKIYEKKSTLIKIHGTISYPLTLRQLVDNVQEFEPAKSKLLTEILTNSVVVIIGFGFNTPNLQKLFFDLIHKNKIKDIFLVKRSFTGENDFLNFLMKDRPYNIILRDCESFAIDLVEKLEKLELQKSTVQKNFNKKDGEKDEIKISFSRFFHKFSRHLFRNFIFKDLRAYPAPCVKFLVEFVLSLFQGKGLITDRGLYENEVIMSLFSEDRSLLKIALEKEKSNLYKYKFYNDSEKGNAKEVFEDFKEQLANFIYFFKRRKFWFPFEKKNSRDLIEQVSIPIEKLEILASLPNCKKVDISILLSREFDLDYLIDLFHQVKLFLLNKKFDSSFNPLKRNVDKILKNLYKLKFYQIEQIDQLENKDLRYLVKKLLNKDIESGKTKVNIICYLVKNLIKKLLNQNNQNIKDIEMNILKEIYGFKSFFKDQKNIPPIRMYFEQFYWLLCDQKKYKKNNCIDSCLSRRSKVFVRDLIEFLLDSRVLFYDKIYYLLITENKFEEIKKKLLSFFFDFECNVREPKKGYKKKIESLSDIVKTFDIIVKPYHFVLPFVEEVGEVTRSSQKEEKICEVYEIKNRIELQLLTQYLLNRFINRVFEHSMFVVADSGEWVLKAISEGLLKLEKSKPKNIYLVISKKFDETYNNLHRNCHLCLTSFKKEQLQNQFKTKKAIFKICALEFYRNNLHFFLLKKLNNKKDGDVFLGIIFHRNLKSSFISPVFLKAKDSSLQSPTISVLDDLLQEVEEKCASK